MVECVKWCNCFLCPLRPWVSLPEVSQWSVSPLTNSNPEQYVAAADVVFLHRGGTSLVRPVHRPRWGWQYFRDNINSGFPPLSLHSPGCRRNCTRLEGRSGSALLAHAHCVAFHLCSPSVLARADVCHLRAASLMLNSLIRCLWHPQKTPSETQRQSGVFVRRTLPYPRGAFVRTPFPTAFCVLRPQMVACSHSL